MKKSIRFIILLTLMLAGCQNEEQTIPEEAVDLSEPPKYIQAPDDIVNMHGEITNLERFYAFVDHVEQGKNDKVRIVKYTTEGAPMIHDLQFDGTEIHSIYDSTRDGFGSRSIEEANCEGIAVVKTDTRTDYVLEECSNQKEWDKTILVIQE
ncbi:MULTISPECIES: DUF4362 domain-containing protein [Mesobacillus]|uniref:DUF4362 domain-containing protein n=1 Tax=Mesobacillus TaxID=2675231 RepID=UPI001783623B|nr:MULTISPECIES: DUF4362 domain-containing protein [Mesobacillus]MCM3575710.1 DUF4362 domain-containing protein [Mesobacillus subterraneus]UYZ24137.1 DUF4362 domain-containing protein [Mesobacillus jeotgali]